ncbi:endonuclease/exonuclease/phosphatase family protein [Pectobacterium polaris]|uniref:endonuclease/exonuclease/phosphatase family protein n=1 Tax=Pectobacterium polaris TaxID=2042057 RepID=UPI000AF1AA8F|nr:endonuclease/exonuclease/phosphatase family protein [Pectobacterium polaris]ASY75581.1 hypothetical protein BJJ97_06490 [Pectobacterium polaris]MCU1795688.1 endonuclease/exonuclease/phosphatase family protein [Pectobacterium polaris]
MKISFWNTGLKHKAEKNPDYQSLIVEALSSMIINHSLDIVFICEVDDDFTLDTRIEKYFSDISVKLIRGTEKVSGNIKFDICALYNEKKSSATLKNYIIHNNMDDEDHRKGNNTKTGILFDVSVRGSDAEYDDSISIIVSHWPSKLTPGYEFRHKDAAEQLKRESVEKIKQGRQVILLGDYNMSPYETINETNLCSYNNKYYALKNSTRLYNLSFNFHNQHTDLFDLTHTSEPMGFGTFLSNGNRHSEIGCAVFDHIHVSSSFIKDGPWIVNEKETKIFVSDEIFKLVYDKNVLLDHLPIVIEINKNERKSI